MKFDRIIMNPPYNKNLHLKILSEAMKHSDEIVNLSPIRWLQDPLAEYKKNSDFKKFENIRNKIESIEVIEKAEAQDLFNVGFNMYLGIYKVGNGGFNSYSLQRHYNLVRKIKERMKSSFLDNVERNRIDGWRVRVNELQPMDPGNNRGHIEWWRRQIVNPNTKTYVYKDGYTKDGEYWTTLVAPGKYTKKVGDPLPFSIKFNTEQEALNFEAYCKLKLPNFLKAVCQTDMNVPLMIFPYLDDYTHPWTDEMLYKYFNLTPEEIEVIENETQ